MDAASELFRNTYTQSKGRGMTKKISFVTLNLILWKIVACRTFRELASVRIFSKVRLEEIELIVACVTNVSATYSSGRSVIFLSEQLESDLSETLVRKMSGETKMIMSTSSTTSPSIGFFFFFHGDREARATSYANVLERLPPNDVVRFAIILDFQDKIDLRRIQQILEEFWLHQIIDVIVLVPYRISQNIRIYSYYPFSSTRCGETGPPILINVWNSRVRAFLNQNDLFSRIKKIFNLHSCPLRCVGIHRPPESTIALMPGNTWRLSGTGNKVFKFIRRYLNFTARISMIKRIEQSDRERDKNLTSTPTMFRYDIAFGKFIRILDSQEPNVDFITENVMDCFTWAVPYGIGRQPSIWTKYSIEFSLLIWLLIAVNIFLTSFVLRWMVGRLSSSSISISVKYGREWYAFHYILFYTFSTFVGANIKLKTKSTSMRIFVSQWLFYSLVITSAYQAYMGSLMTIPQAEAQINRQIDLLNMNLNLVGRKEMFYLLNESAADSAEFRSVLARFFILPPTDFDAVIYRMIEHRDIAVFTSKRELIYYAQKRRKHLNERQDIHIFSDCIIKSYSSVFMLKKGSPFQDPIHKTLTRLFETGIYSYWDNENVLEEMYRNVVFSKETILELHELYGAFLVLLIGLGLSTILFVLELFGKMIRDKAANNDRKIIVVSR